MGSPGDWEKSSYRKRKGVNQFLKALSKGGQKPVCFTSGLRREANATAEVFFKESEGSLQSVFGSDRKYWSVGVKQALGLGDSGGFPYQLSPLGSKVSLPIPAVPFEGKAPSLKKIFNSEIEIQVTPDKHFTNKFREIFPLLQSAQFFFTFKIRTLFFLNGSNLSISFLDFISKNFHMFLFFFSLRREFFRLL